jgi:hypothetical protein
MKLQNSINRIVNNRFEKVEVLKKLYKYCAFSFSSTVKTPKHAYNYQFVTPIPETHKLTGEDSNHL